MNILYFFIPFNKRDNTCDVDIFKNARLIDTWTSTPQAKDELAELGMAGASVRYSETKPRRMDSRDRLIVHAHGQDPNKPRSDTDILSGITGVFITQNDVIDQLNSMYAGDAD